MLAAHPKHNAVEDRLSSATEILIPDLLVIELQWVVLSGRYPEIDAKVFGDVMEAIQSDPQIRLLPVTPRVAMEQSKWYDKLSFFDAYYAAFSVVHKMKLLTTDPDFKAYKFAEVL